MPAKPIRRLLVANRGEIAVRVARAARESGIVPLGVFSDADAHAYHLEFMQDAARLGPAPARESYLDIGRVIDAARSLGADAIHPGYGFLSERAPFAQAVADAGLIFVGPPPAAIAAMGDKIESKKAAAAAKVSTVPGHLGVIADEKHAVKIADEIGYPVMIKASAGGGGKGMRPVDDRAELEDAFQTASGEALAAFGDGSLYVEKVLVPARHVEVQVLADGDGNVVHLGERDCSVQRRHQKLIEEAPSTHLTPEMRKDIGEKAVAGATSIGYTGAGTMEFLLDHDGNLAFIEMNPRIQVEHTVTELATGLDLVREQVLIAAGEPLWLRQEDVRLNGHAIECRINAEDPSTGFLPTPGRISGYREPGGPGVRVDSGVEDGSEISPLYDPMIAKLIVHDDTRVAAIARAIRALREFEIETTALQQTDGAVARATWDLSDPGAFLCRTADIRDLRMTFIEILKGRDVVISRSDFIHRWVSLRGDARRDLLDRIATDAKSVLEFGCGEAPLGAALKERQQCRVVGIELDPKAAAVARKRIDDVYCGDAREIVSVLKEKFDWIIGGDIVEHLDEPWTFLSELRHVSAPGGHLLLSIPNIANAAVISDLLHGRFDYVYMGLTCVGHLRFFTRQSIEEMIAIAGWTIVEITPQETIRTRGVEELLSALGRDFSREDLLPAGYYVVAQNR